MKIVNTGKYMFCSWLLSKGSYGLSTTVFEHLVFILTIPPNALGK